MQNEQSKRIFNIIEKATEYDLPNYHVIDGKGIEPDGSYTKIVFVRGSKLAEENVEKKTGVLHETLLAMAIEDLTEKSKLVPSRETSLAITKLQEALFWLEERHRNRVAAGTIGTYKK